jgi:hypothetical protein
MRLDEPALGAKVVAGVLFSAVAEGNVLTNPAWRAAHSDVSTENCQDRQIDL